jgi:hypothetical protein
MDTSHALYKAIICVDIERFTDSARRDKHRVAMRNALYAALERAFTRSRIPWSECHIEDRGDGAFILVDPDVPKARLADPLPFELATELSRHNETADSETRVRLRVAFNAGDVYIQRNGVVGDPVNLTFRLLDAPEFKQALREAPGDLALITSAAFYQEVISQGGTVDLSAYRSERVSTKDATAQAWICGSGTQLEAGREYGSRLPDIEATLDAAAAVLEEARRCRDDVIRRIESPVPYVPDLDTTLPEHRETLDALRTQGRWTELSAHLADFERVADARLDEARSAHLAVRAPLDHRDELRGLLSAYQAMAGDQGRVEEVHLGRLFQRAYELLWQAPCDLIEAEAATMEYVRAVQRESDSRP